LLEQFNKNDGHDCDRRIQMFGAILDCGGKRSATPLSCGRKIFSCMTAPRAGESGAKAIALQTLREVENRVAVAERLDCGAFTAALVRAEVFPRLPAFGAGARGVAVAFRHHSPKRWRDSGNPGQFNGYSIC
jgi:hypothetical protein